MPIIADESGCVVNGIGRLQMVAEAGESSWYVLTLDPTRAEFAHAMLNLLSMDFDLHAKYADLLRYNSFRRSHHRRPYLGRGMTYWVIGGRPSRQFNIANAMDRAKWVKVHGTSVVDFGAGHFTETDLLRSAGIHVAAFEPYRLTGSEIDRPKSIESARLFLTDVASGRRYESVFVSSVLNSVPFYEDRRAIVKIVSALCDGKAYFVALHTQCVAYRTFQAQYLNNADAGKSRLKLDYEPGIAMGDISELPKIQKYHTPEEFYALLKTAFQTVQVTIDGGNVCAVAAQPFDIAHGLNFSPSSSTCPTRTDSASAWPTKPSPPSRKDWGLPYDRSARPQLHLCRKQRGGQGEDRRTVRRQRDLPRLAARPHSPARGHPYDRPAEQHRAATLANIAAKTGGWQLADAYFNYANLPPASAKFAYLTQYVFPKYGENPH